MTQEDFQKIEGIISFMRATTTMVDPTEVYLKSKLNTLDYFNENQLSFMLMRAGSNSPHLRELFYALKQLNTVDIRLLNSKQNVFDYWALIAGALFYTKAIKRFIKKEDILLVKDILDDIGYRFIFDFSNSGLCQGDYLLHDDFKNQFLYVGYKVINTYYENIDPLITHFLFSRISVPDTKEMLSHLRISKEYIIILAQQSRDFILSQSE
jgi:hypothetical protein